MTEPIAYLNGNYVANSACRLPMYDAGIVLGAAVTDLMRTFRGIPYQVEAHIGRFIESARYACLSLHADASELQGIVRHLVDHNARVWTGREIAVILYASAGEFPVYAGSASSGSSGDAAPLTLVVHTFPLPLSLWRPHVTTGVHVVTPTQRHLPPNTLSSKIKHRNRLHMWIGDTQARLVDPNAIGLYLDQNGNITETGGANFVIVKHGTIYSPSRNNILWGITLSVVCQIAASRGVGFVERDLQLHDVVNADEAWLVTTPYFLAPAVKINTIPIGTGCPGPLWRSFMSDFSQQVGIDVVAQIVGSDETSPSTDR
jgi:branched-chain amino acid aminotransferase